MLTNPAPTRNAVCLCADQRMMIPAIFVAKSILSASRLGGIPFDVIIFAEVEEVTDLLRAWIQANGIKLRTDIDVSAC